LESLDVEVVGNAYTMADIRTYTEAWSEMDKRKVKLQKLNDSASNKIEMKLMKELANVESLIDVQLYNRVSVQLSNNWCLVANLSSRECNCSWWQTQGFPCWHAMVVIKKEKKWM